MNDPHYLHLADIIARFGVDGERKLVHAHVARRVTLVGRRRREEGVEAELASIPPEALADWKPCRRGVIRFNPQNNSIEADARSKDFASFEHKVRHGGWSDVQAATYEVAAEISYLAANIDIITDQPPSATKPPRRDSVAASAIKQSAQKLLDCGKNPPNNISWTAFCVEVRDESDGWIDKKAGQYQRGFSDKMIKRHATKIQRDKLDI